MKTSKRIPKNFIEYIQNPDENSFGLYISFDDYNPLNDRIADLLDSYGIKATFYITTDTDEAIEQIKRLHARGHIIGAHTISHPPDLKSLPHAEARSEIQGSKQMIEDATGEECAEFAYPRGRHNDDVRNIVNRSGFMFARTTRVLATDISEYQEPMNLPTTVHVFDDRKEYRGRSFRDMAHFHLDHVMTNGGVFSLWGHAHEIQRDNLWDDLKSVLEKIYNNSNHA